MNAAVLPILAQFPLGVAAFCCLALAMERHARQAGSRFQHPRQRTMLRWTGWILLATTLFLAVATVGWGFGLVQYFAVLSAASAVVVCLISYRSSWLIGVAAANGFASLLLLGFSHAGCCY